MTASADGEAAALIEGIVAAVRTGADRRISRLVGLLFERAGVEDLYALQNDLGE